MRRKTSRSTQTFILALLTALVLRPAIVSAHNGMVLEKAHHEGNTLTSVLSASHTLIHHLGKEAPPDLSALIPRFARTKAPLALGSPVKLVFTSFYTVPKSFLVLRI